MTGYRDGRDGEAGHWRVEALEARLLMAADQPLISGIFDGGLKTTAAEIVVNYGDRGVEAWDAYGNPVAADEPVWGPETAVGSISSWEATDVTVTVLGNNATVIGSGRDHDGQTPLAVIAGAAWPKLFVLRGDASLDSMTTINIAREGTRDLMLGQAQQMEYYVFWPGWAQIIDGLIVVMTKVLHDRGEGGPGHRDWQPYAEAFAYSQDYGQTWALIPIDGQLMSDPIGPEGTNRAALFAFGSPVPWQPVREAPLRVTFTGCDYVHGATVAEKMGGQSFMFDAYRSAVGESWTVLPAVSVNRHDAGQENQHAHTAWAVIRENQRWVYTMFGDATSGRTVVTVFDDKYDYQNAARTEYLIEGGDSADDPDGYDRTSAIQAVDIAPTDEGVLVKGDWAQGVVIHLVAPDDPADSLAAQVVHSGMVMDDGRGGNHFHIHHDRGRYVANQAPNPQYTQAAQRLLYSVDGLHWIEIAAVTGVKDPDYTSPRPFLFGDYLITVLSGVLCRLPLPEVSRTMRPLIAAQGGTNQMVDDLATVSLDGTTVTKLTRVGDRVVGTDPTGVSVDVEAPPGDADVYLINSTTATGYRSLSLTGVLGVDPKQVTTMWVRVLPGLVATGVDFGVDDVAVSNDAMVSFGKMIDTEQWTRVMNARDTGGIGWTAQITNGRTTAFDMYLLVSLDTVVSGEYRSAPHTIPAGSTAASEYVSISGFTGADDWTVATSVSVPEGYWDSYMMASQGYAQGHGQTEWPLLTIWSDQTPGAEDYIEFYMMAGGNPYMAQGIVARGMADGQPFGDYAVASNIYLNPKTPIVIAVSQDADNPTQKLHTTVSVGGSIVGDSVIGGQIALATGPTQIRWSNHDQSDMTALAIHAWAVDPDTFYGRAARKALIKGPVLVRSGSPGDFNADGKVTLLDIDPFILAVTDRQRFTELYPRVDLYGADPDQNGQVDLRDIAPFIAWMTGQAAPVDGPIVELAMGEQIGVTEVPFGQVQLNEMSEQTLVVTNVGTRNLVISDVTMSGAGFSFEPLAPSDGEGQWTIIPGGSIDFAVRFQPGSAAQLGATLAVTSSDPNHPMMTVQLTGEGVMSPDGDITVDQLGGQTNVHTVDFGAVYTDGTASHTLVVRNDGMSTLTVSTLGLSGAGFTVDRVNGPDIADDWVLEPGMSTQVTITFGPSYGGPFNGLLRLGSDDPNEGYYDLSLTGWGGGLGDANVDGRTNLLDIDPFVLLIARPNVYSALYPAVNPRTVGDFDGDGQVTLLDINGFISLIVSGLG